MNILFYQVRYEIALQNKGFQNKKQDIFEILASDLVERILFSRNVDSWDRLYCTRINFSYGYFAQHSGRKYLEY